MKRIMFFIFVLTKTRLFPSIIIGEKQTISNKPAS